MDQRFGDLRLQRGTVRYRQRAYALHDVSASVRQLSVPTAHRRPHAGLLGKVLPSRTGRGAGQTVLTIGGPAFEWIIPIPERRVAAARDFAAQVNIAAHEYLIARGEAEPKVQAAEEMPSIVEHALAIDDQPDRRHANRSRS